jgi:hypothetical protein
VKVDRVVGNVLDRSRHRLYRVEGYRSRFVEAGWARHWVHKGGNSVVSYSSRDHYCSGSSSRVGSISKFIGWLKFCVGS